MTRSDSSVSPILLTCFEPFGGEPENSSRMMLRAFAREFEFELRCLPVVFQDAPSALATALREVQPRVAIAFGQASTPFFRLERQAMNWDAAPKPDNQGAIRSGSPIIAGAPEYYPSRLPLEKMLLKLKQAEFPAELSDSAGNYVCNQVFYHLMHSAPEVCPVRGFVHVPALPKDGAWTYESWAEWARPVIRILVETACEELLAGDQD